jgi:RNA polymerase-binding transcription factor DksA
MLNEQQLEKLKTAIDQRYATLEHEVHSDVARTRTDTRQNITGPVGDSGDDATANLVFDVDNAELTRDLNELRQLDAARGRMADQTFGQCVDCGREIPFERLMANPAALRCVEDQEKFEKTHGGPTRSSL